MGLLGAMFLLFAYGGFIYTGLDRPTGQNKFGTQVAVGIVGIVALQLL